MLRPTTLMLVVVLISSIAKAQQASPQEPRDDASLVIHARSQLVGEQAPADIDRGRRRSQIRELAWQASETAIVVCDMWDKHWCRGATARVAEMAPRLNEVLHAARDRGVLVIHCPSSCVDFYRDTPMVRLATDAPQAKSVVELKGWCHLDSKREPPLPIDDSDGGCDCNPPCKNYTAWTRQIAAIDIKEGDAITDSTKAYDLMVARGIKNVIVTGVHTNMCVLGRPFSIRQLVYQNLNVVLMRDMTDTMYNSAMSPYVNHFDGNRLVAQHIERYWCPTMLSTDLTNKPEFIFSGDQRPEHTHGSPHDE
ncbi:cysteine hydrolase family protein [Stieleria varia]|uniref:Isochorismatase family protein n=1 Tax=Stieleria varia TaxID=2528005 RepID=A0A5C6BBR7_9BACT|nr:isochorismatase family protein [Stieleria varia]TWU07964.1 Isochorismatase family protein [Stieleria varia]